MTTTKSFIRVSLPDTNTSKSEEVEILSKLVVEFAGTQSYLSGLFSDALLGWFEQQVRNDFSCNIMDEVEWNQSTAAKNAQDAKEAADTLRATVKALQDEVSRQTREIDRLNKLVTQQAENIEFAHQRNEQDRQRFGDQAVRLSRENTRLRNELDGVRKVIAMTVDQEAIQALYDEAGFAD